MLEPTPVDPPGSWVGASVTFENRFEDFYRGEFDAVYVASYAFCRDREAALDATQEAFGRAFARWTRLRKEPWAGGWVMTTALNLCRQYLRDARRRADPDPLPSGDPVGPVSSDHLDLWDSISRLPDRQRQAAILYYFGDHPLSLVAELMNISQGAVKRHLARARESLRASLADPYGNNS